MTRGEATGFGRAQSLLVEKVRVHARNAIGASEFELGVWIAGVVFAVERAVGQILGRAQGNELGALVAHDGAAQSAMVFAVQKVEAFGAAWAQVDVFVFDPGHD